MQKQNVEQQTPKNALFSQRKQITSTDQSAHTFILQTLMSQHFILFPKENYIKKPSRSLEILEDETVNEKANLLTLLQRQRKPKRTIGETKTPRASQQIASDREIVEKRVLKSLSMMKPWQLEKSKPILRKIYDDPDISVNEEGLLTEGDQTTSLEAKNFLFDLQQPKKGLHDPDYRRILEKLEVSSHLIPNSQAEKLLQSSTGRKKVTVKPRIKSSGKQTARTTRKIEIDDEEAESIDEDYEDEANTSKRWDRLDSRTEVALYRKGPFAYGSIHNLSKESNLSS